MFFDPTQSCSYELTALFRLLLAALAGGLIGIEREKHGRPAGLRTHLLVCIGSTLLMLVSEGFTVKYGGLDATTPLRLDPSRTAAQIVTGIGFLGAGVIIKEGLSVRGLTTAASLWLVAGIGMAFGMGLFWPAVMATVMAFCFLVFLKKLEPVINKDRYLHLTVTASVRSDLLAELHQLFANRNLNVTDIESELDLEQNLLRYNLILSRQKKRIGQELTSAICSLEGVKKIRYR